MVGHSTCSFKLFVATLSVSTNKRKNPVSVSLSGDLKLQIMSKPTAGQTGGRNEAGMGHRLQHEKKACNELRA